jgi:hypothetical protein
LRARRAVSRGPGFGRTGTLSLKLALERLGFGPCRRRRRLDAALPLPRRGGARGAVSSRELHRAVLETGPGRTPLSRRASVRTSIGGRRAAEAATEPGALVDGDQSTEGPDLPIRSHSGDGGPFSKIQPPDRRRAFAFGSGRLTSDSRYLNTRRPCSTVLYCRANSKVRRHPNMSSYTTIP